MHILLLSASKVNGALDGVRASLNQSRQWCQYVEAIDYPHRADSFSRIYNVSFVGCIATLREAALTAIMHGGWSTQQGAQKYP